MKLRSLVLSVAVAIGLATLTACGVGAVAAPLPKAPSSATPVSEPATTPAQGRSISFSAVGDIGGDANASAVLTAIGKAETDLTLAVGDLSYGQDDEEQQWCDFVKERVGASHPFELLSGNHESNGKNGNINDFAACLPNQLSGLVGTYGRRYYVDVPQQNPLVRFVMISPGLEFPGPDDDFNRGGSEYLWAEQAIDSARAAGVPWVVVGAHVPCVSMGQYACAMGTDLFSMLLEKRVDLVLGGHEHLYQRTNQLATDASGCAEIVPGGFNPSCVADTDGAFAAGSGTVYATVGAGGRPLRAIATDDAESGYFAAASAKNQVPTHGFLKVTVEQKKMTAQFVGVGGSFEDAFTISR